MSRARLFHNFMELYTTGMLPCSVPIGWIAGQEYARGRCSAWQSASTAVVGTLFYPVTIYYIYKNH
ncbi:putative transmembrane protein [Cedratvirus kamchatka]|uniref:Transmembrane protein n=1 Tax=Cedratvirus kamchatka TaxID=2716914 RepID=A0A6G8MZS2_9VIRU|nr:putative transmembrane protein [Cedratvirus kamchatka]WIL04408.1 putative membrane protein [Cedratvirus lena]WIL05001.1 putative membrane protein [Cedratvirus duvanny]